MSDRADDARWLRDRQALAAVPLRRLRLLAPLTGLLVVLQAWLLAQVIDRATFGGAGLKDLGPWLAALPLLFVLRFLAQWQSDRLGLQAAFTVKQALREAMIERLRAAGPLTLEGQQSGRLATALVEAVEALEPYFARFVPALVLLSAAPLAILVAVFAADWLSGVVLLVTAPLVPLFMTLIGREAERRNQRQWCQLARMGGHFLKALQALPTLKLFNASRRELETIARLSEGFRERTMAVLRVAFLTSAALEFLAAISIALVAVFVGFRLLDGEMTFLHGFFVLLLAPEFYQPLRNYGVQNHARMEAVAAAEQIRAVLELPASPVTAPAAATQEHDFAGPIRLRHVHFAYADRQPALTDLSLTIEPGEHLAIVGPSGAGKSTLMRLLLGFVLPQQGTLSVGETPLDEALLPAWRRRLGWVPQRPRLFHGSIADNIRLGWPEAPEEAVRQAARDARVLDFADVLPQGLDTPLGEGGTGLSGGQAQRVALARALLRRPDWLLLDEPTAHLDRTTEAAVTATLERLRGHCGILSIAHRLHTLRRADRILVLEQGRIVQEGPFQALADKPGPFRDLLRDSREILP